MKGGREPGRWIPSGFTEMAYQDGVCPELVDSYCVVGGVGEGLGRDVRKGREAEEEWAFELTCSPGLQFVFAEVLN